MVPFRTPFWLDDKRWFVTCAYVPKACAIWLHTTPIRGSGIERLVRCEVSWIDRQCRLTQRSIDEMVDNTNDEVCSRMYLTHSMRILFCNLKSYIRIYFYTACLRYEINLRTSSCF